MKKKFWTRFWGNILLKNIFLAAITVIALLICSSIFLDVFTRHGKSSPLPDFRGKHLDSVRVIAHKSNLRIEIIDSVFRVDVPRGTVFLQNPEAGTHVKKNRKIFLTMNALSPKKEALPKVEGYSLRRAKTELITKGFRVGKLLYVDDYATNNVLQQMYKGSKAEPGILLSVGEYIDLKLGLNPTDSTRLLVPDLIGLPKQQAEDLIIENSQNYLLVFDKGIKTVTDSLNSVVYKQEPASGSRSYYGNNVKIWLRLTKK
ncbi:MAG: PASTA domain-containing protein [Prevotellaceae bacterium]|jgi:beta-lactam-binding protein with PASTA domain|nr:PASTA domain-containing protein [Prevotellaceae bacterium]